MYSQPWLRGGSSSEKLSVLPSPAAVALNDASDRMNVCVISVPSVVASVFTSRRSCSPDVQNRIFATLSAASFVANSSATFVSIGTSIGSFTTGVIHVPLAGATGASSTGRRIVLFAARERRTASRAQRATASFVIVAVDANPHAPSTSVRTPIPYDSESVTPVI